MRISNTDKILIGGGLLLLLLLIFKKKKMNVSDHLTIEQATSTGTGLLNQPNAAQLLNMKFAAKNLYEKIYSRFPDVSVNSNFRSPAVNTAIGGSKTSDHLNGLAYDLTRGSRAKNAEMFNFIGKNLRFDQLISEKQDYTGPAWVHVSLRKDNNRLQIFST